MTAYRWAQKDIYNSSSATASDGAITWVKMPEGADNIRISVETSGSYSSITEGNMFVATSNFGRTTTGGEKTLSSLVRASVLTQRLFSLAPTIASNSSTYHVLTSTENPRYVGVSRSGTAQGHILVRAYFRERAY